MIASQYSEAQLDALRELANVASGTAATSLSQMLGREIDLSVPRALALPMAEAAESLGDPAETTVGVALPIQGELAGVVLLLIPVESARVLCGMLGVDWDSEVGESALAEIGNILSAGYLNGLGAMTGLTIEPAPPHLITDLLGAIVSSVLAATAGHGDTALVLDSDLVVGGDACGISFVLLPEGDGATGLLAPLGLA